MNSLRARLILGSSLIAIVPLALAVLLLSRQIETLVREQAAERLDAALGGLTAQLDQERERIGEQLRILGRDPTLKRLFLVRSAASRDLADHLAEQRLLLGLGFLEVTGEGGAAIARAAARDTTAAPALGASAPILYQDAPVGTVSGGLWLDESFLRRLRQSTGVELVLRRPDDRVVAATLSGVEPAPAPAGAALSRFEVAGASYLGRAVSLDHLSAGTTVLGMISTAAADRTLAGLRLTAALLGLAGLVIAVALGILWSSQVSGPVEKIAAFSRRVSQGEWEEPLALSSVRELETLAEALDRMRHDLRAYRDRLVVSERQAAWSQMARKVAHEIKNPLTPIAISIADLERSYQQRRPDFPQILEQAVRTVGEEVETLKRLLQGFSELGRFPPPRPGPCRLPDLVADLEALYGHEVADGRLEFVRPVLDAAFTADAGQLKQALVNLIKNGLEAVEGGGRVTVTATASDDAVEIAVHDDGPGLSAEQRANLFVPGFTTKAAGSGLGLTIVERIASDHGGAVAADAEPGGGTTFRLRLPLGPRS